MLALTLFRSGQLREAISTLSEELKKSPLDTKKRTFLFELLCFAGEYDRAQKQLDMLDNAGKEAAAGCLLYRSALHAERVRSQMFERGELPDIDNDVQDEGIAGTLNGVDVSEIRDVDPRIGPNLELFIAGSYTWVPFRYVERVEFERPTELRDLIWARARIRATAPFRLQDIGEVLVPILSPLSWKSTDEAIALGRITTWEDDQHYGAIPLGQKMLAAGSAEVPFLEIHSLTCRSSAEEVSHASA